MDRTRADKARAVGTWTVGVLAAGAENVEQLARGAETTIEAARASAADAVAVAAATRGREEYRVTIAGTHMMIMPGLDNDGRLDIRGMRYAVHSIRADRVC